MTKKDTFLDTIQMNQIRRKCDCRCGRSFKLLYCSRIITYPWCLWQICQWLYLPSQRHRHRLSVSYRISISQCLSHNNQCPREDPAIPSITIRLLAPKDPRFLRIYIFLRICTEESKTIVKLKAKHLYKGDHSFISSIQAT